MSTLVPPTANSFIPLAGTSSARQTRVHPGARVTAAGAAGLGSVPASILFAPFTPGSYRSRSTGQPPTMWEEIGRASCREGRWPGAPQDDKKGQEMLRGHAQ